MISHSHITRRFILDLGPIFRCGITPYFNKSPWPLTLSRHTYPFSIINRIKISHNVLITLLNVHLKRFSKIGYNRTCKNVYILTMQASYLIAKPGTIPLGSKTLSIILDLPDTYCSCYLWMLRVAWQFLWATLQHIGFGVIMTYWITSLYSASSAAVRVIKLRLDYFSTTALIQTR